MLWALALRAPSPAQEGTLDFLDGETLYEGGWLVTSGYEFETRRGLRVRDRRVRDPVERRETEHTATLSGHYGLRNDVQLGAILPTVFRMREQDDPAGPDRLGAEGLGDFTLLGKWRFWRWDAPHQALNTAVIGGLELPTGSDHERDGGRRLPPDLQPGSGSWDPMAGLGATYEPRRWRFSSFALYKYNSQNGHGYKFGDEFFAEVAVGNRFWLQPYPGPFLRGDAMLRYRYQGRGREQGRIEHDTGGDLLTAGANVAFRPRPSLDFQLAVEVPVYERVNGIQAAEAVSVSFFLGYRF